MLIYFKTVILNASTQSKIPSFPMNWKIKKKYRMWGEEESTIQSLHFTLIS